MRQMSVIVAMGLVILLCLACSPVMATDLVIVNGSGGWGNFSATIEIPLNTTALQSEIQLSSKTNETILLNEQGRNVNVNIASIDSISATMPHSLLERIDTNTPLYYRDAWGITEEQFKVMIAVLAWAESRNLGYAAHSSDEHDVWHPDLKYSFHFSEGLGPFQITNSVDGWSTLDKLNPDKNIKQALLLHQNFGGHNDELFNSLEGLRFRMSAEGFGQFFAYNNIGKDAGYWAARWKEVTGTDWDSVKNSNKNTAFLEGQTISWTQIKEKLIKKEQEESWAKEDEAVQYIGYQKWIINENDEVLGVTDNIEHITYKITVNDYLETWIIHAEKGWDRSTALKYSYYYTIFTDHSIPDHDRNIEVLGYLNEAKPLNNKRSFFWRTFNKQPLEGQEYPDSNGKTFDTHDIIDMDGITLIETLKIPENPKVGQTITGTFKIENFGLKNVILNDIKIGGRYIQDGKEVQTGALPDFTSSQKTLEPSENWTYTGTLKLTKEGQVHFFCTYSPYHDDANNWNTYVPFFTDEIKNYKDITVQPRWRWLKILGDLLDSIIKRMPSQSTQPILSEAFSSTQSLQNNLQLKSDVTAIADAFFEYGLTPDLGLKTENFAIYSDGNYTFVEPEFEPDTVYYYRPVIFVNNTWVNGSIWSFNTSGVIPTPDPSPNPRVNGIDVSHWQKTIDWQKVKDSGISFAFVRAQYGSYTHDRTFAANMQAAQNAGIKALPYHVKGFPGVSEMSSNQQIIDDARDEAGQFYTQAQSYLTEGKLQPGLAIAQEDINNYFPSDIGSQKLVLWIDTWIGYLKEKNSALEPIIYTSESGVSHIGVENYPHWWIGLWGSSTPVNTWDFWQWTDRQNIDGVVGDVDADFFNGDLAQLESKFVIGKSSTSSSVTPNITWQRCFGSSSSYVAAGDDGKKIIQTQDGGYIILGSVAGSNGDFEKNYQGFPSVLIKIQPDGEQQWMTFIDAADVIVTESGGYITLGKSDKTVSWLDSNGIIQSQKIFDTILFQGKSISRLDDGTYLISSTSYQGGCDHYLQITESGDKVWENSFTGWGTAIKYQSSLDYFLVLNGRTISKYKHNGDIIWSKSYGSQQTGGIFSNNLIENPDGTIVFTTYAYGYGTSYHGEQDIWVVKIASDGNIIWEKCYGGAKSEESTAIYLTKDGEYVIAGITRSIDGDLSELKMNSSIEALWFFKIDTNGVIKRSVTVDGINYVNSITRLNDDGYLINGVGVSELLPNYHSSGSTDISLIKISENFQIVWIKCFGGNREESASSVIETRNGDLVFTGTTYSNDGDINYRIGDKGDIWIAKLSDWQNPPLPLVISANPNQLSSFQVYSPQYADIAGTDFSSGLTVILRNNNGRVISGLVNEFVSPSKVSCTFDLLNADPGYYDIVVTNPDGGKGTLTNGFHYTVINATEKVWHSNVIAQAQDSDYIRSVTIALDTNGMPHVAFILNKHMNYAVFNGSHWSVEELPDTVLYDEMIVDQKGQKLALDSLDLPHIVYRNGPDNGLNQTLNYTTFNGYSWHTEIIENAGYPNEIKLKVDSQNLPHVIYQLFANGDTKVKYSYFNGTRWEIKNISSSGSSAFMLDKSGFPHILTNYVGCGWSDCFGSLIYDYKDSANWNTQYFGSVLGYAGDLSADIDHENHLNLVFSKWPYNSGKSILNYGHYDGRIWRFESPSPYPYTQNSILHLNTTGQPTILYTGTNGKVNYLQFDGHRWYNSTVNNEYANSYDYALDAQDIPHIVYLKGRSLMYATTSSLIEPPSPIADFITNATTGTAPLAIEFMDISTGSPITWVWSFGDNSVATVQNPIHTYATAGLYTVSLKATNAGGSNTTIRTNYITVIVPAPVANFSATPTTGTVPLTVTFTDSSTNSPTEWNWSFGDGSLVNVTAKNPVHPYLSAGTYTVSLNVTNSGGSNITTRTSYIVVKPPVPVTDFGGYPTSGKIPLTVQFIDSSLGSPTEWNWSFGDGALSNVKNPIYTYTAAGTFTVSLNATNEGGSNSTTRLNYITVLPLIPPVAGFDANVTSGKVPLTVQFNDTSTGSPTSWNWSFGNGALSTMQNPVHTYTASGTFTVSLNVTNSDGSNSSSRLNYITVLPLVPPVAGFDANATSGNVPLTVQFNDTSTGSPIAWNWSFGDGALSSEKNPVHIYVTAGNYSVSLNVTNSDGSNLTVKDGYLTIFPKGDFNHNWQVDIGDVSRVAWMVVGRTPLIFPDADFNGNGVIDVGDAAKIAWFGVGKIPAL
jgi:PKD repeat protein/GH25 family lysozyme M1 (1,4-beta-N-acetylmuramidase)